MRTILTLGVVAWVVAVLVVLTMARGEPGSAMSDDPFVDSVASVVGNFGDPGGSFSGVAAAEDDVVGAPDDEFIQLADETVLVAKFDDNVALDGSGDDIRIHTFDTLFPASATVEVSNDGVTFFSVGTATDANASNFDDFDISGTGLPFVTHIRLTDLGDGDFPALGFDLDAIEALHSLGHDDIVKDTSDTTINITSSDGFDAKQSFQFTITITNNTGVNGGLSGLTFVDVVPAEFDVDNAEVTGEPSFGDCTVSDAEGGAKGKGKGNQKLAPDVVTITAAGLDDGESCEITVDVSTDDDHPGQGNNPVWTPTSCPDTTIVLNDGVRVFDAAGNLVLEDDDTLELTCN